MSYDDLEYVQPVTGNHWAEQIARRYGYESAIIAASTTTSGGVDMRFWAGGSLKVSADLNGDTVNIQMASLGSTATPASTDYFNLHEGDSTSIVQVSAVTGWNRLPDEVFGAHWIRFVTNNATTSEETLGIALKG